MPGTPSGPDHAPNEDYSAYGGLDNRFEWEIELENINDINA